MEKFCVKAQLRSPAIVHPHANTLDGLLAAILFQQLGDVSEAHASIPLQATAGVFHASTGQLQGQVLRGIHTCIAGLSAVHSLDPDYLKKTAKGTLPKMSLTRKAQYGNVMNSYPTVYATEIYWFAEGDPDRTMDLLADVRCVGKRNNSGMGEVSHWEMYESPLAGLMTEDKQPLRPVPWDTWLALGGSPTAVRADTGWRPAYWELKNRDICAVPDKLEMVPDTF